VPWSSPGANSPRLRVEIVMERGRPPLPAARCRRVLETAAGWFSRRLRGGRRRPPALTVRFASDATMRSLNRRFRGKNRSTDVLSFPASSGGRPAPTPEGPHLGDLAIGVSAARRQARAAGHALSHEIEILLLHGFLHLLGYDHETDSGRMLRVEERLRRRLGLVLARGHGGRGAA